MVRVSPFVSYTGVRDKLYVVPVRDRRSLEPNTTTARGIMWYAEEKRMKTLEDIFVART